MIKIENLTKKYDGLLAVDSLSLEVKKGEVFGFLGPNGAGKTTTIKILSGIIPKDEGKVSVSGRDIDHSGPDYKRNIGYIPDTPFFYPKLSGNEYLNFTMNIFGADKAEFEKNAEELASYFTLSDSLPDYIESYSRGMLQKLAIISVFSRNPEVVLIDEPIVGLDPESVKKFKTLIKNHSLKGKTVFLSTHILEIAEKVADRVGIIHKGKLRFVGTAGELKSKDRGADFEEIFLKLVADGYDDSRNIQI